MLLGRVSGIGEEHHGAIFNIALFVSSMEQATRLYGGPSQLSMFTMRDIVQDACTITHFLLWNLRAMFREATRLDIYQVMQFPSCIMSVLRCMLG